MDVDLVPANLIAEGRRMREIKCSCLKNDTITTRAEEHLRVLFRVNSARLITPLQTIAFHANEEISYLLLRARWRIYEGVRTRFSRLLAQPAVPKSIDRLIDRIKSQIFDDSELTSDEVEEDMGSAVQDFFTHILPSLFLCLSTGPCRTVKQSYISCLRNNTPNLVQLYEERPHQLSLPKLLQIWVVKYRLIKSTIQKLHRIVVESESLEKSCATNFGTVAFCGPECSQQETGHIVGYCRNSCQNAVNKCLQIDIEEWDTFISILSKLMDDFDKGFEELEKEIIRSIAYIMEVQSLVLAKAMYLRCGMLNFQNKKVYGRGWGEMFALVSRYLTDVGTVLEL
ncbi:unnamed protein product [Enterobius vermicularis]|uniref:SET domain-containing protein n=1 Tax=Enterobius vermicularis TaxID=51028 RepID=A0A0N4VFF7_ENTVE|nr:unnamed protein product [Enterobius vermicularis]